VKNGEGKYRPPSKRLEMSAYGGRLLRGVGPETNGKSVVAGKARSRIMRSELAPNPIIPRFHGDCDVAALVYSRGDDPDALLTAFARGLTASGHDVAGVVQSRRLVNAARADPLQFVMLGEDAAGRSQVSLAIELEDVAKRLAPALRRGPDLLVLNRYGTKEASGGGLLEVLSIAIEGDIPVVAGVPEALFPRWLGVAEGLAVRVRPRLESLNAWWRALGRAPARAAPVCEMLK
jgi:hypothetical protein